MTQTRRPHFKFTGIAAGRRLQTLAIAPGLSQIDCRLGDAEAFFGDMTARLRCTTPDSGILSFSAGPLSNLSARPDTDWAGGLLAAWASIGDVLCFYQERMLNEGYLATSRDPQSLHHLQSMLGQNTFRVTTKGSAGYQRDFPGFAGSASVLAELRVREGLPDRLFLEPDMMVRRFSPAGGSVASFVTLERTEVRGEWTRMTLATSRTSQPNAPYLPGSAEAFQGSATALKENHDLLITGHTPDGQAACSLQTILSSRHDALGKVTTVHWRTLGAGTGEGEDANRPQVPLQSERFLTLGAPAACFGHAAPPLSSRPASVRHRYIDAGGFQKWPELSPSEAHRATQGPYPKHEPVILNQGLPAGQIKDWIIGADDTSWIATSEGVFCLSDPARAWLNKTGGLPKTQVTTLTSARDGTVYAGCSTGAVFKALPGEFAWSQIRGAWIENKPAPIRTSLPNAAIHQLRLGEGVSVVDSSKPNTKWLPKRAILAATDMGLYRNDQDGIGWLHIPLPGEKAPGKPTVGALPQSAKAVKEVIPVLLGDEFLLLLAFSQSVLMMRLPRHKAHKSSSDRGLLRSLARWFAPGGGIRNLPKLWDSLMDALTFGPEFIHWIFRGSSAHLPHLDQEIALPGTLIGLNIIPTGKSSFLIATTDKGIFAFDVRQKAFVAWGKNQPGHLTHGTVMPAPELGESPEHIAFLPTSGGLYGFKPDPEEEGRKVLPVGQWEPVETITPQAPPEGKPEARPRLLYSAGAQPITYTQPGYATEWPGFTLGNEYGGLTELDVVGLKTKPLIGSRGVLADGTGAHVVSFTVTSISQRVRSDFGVSSPTLQISLNVETGHFDPALFDRRTARLQFETSEVFRSLATTCAVEPLYENALILKGTICDLSARVLAVSGRACRATLLAEGGGSSLDRG